MATDDFNIAAATAIPSPRHVQESDLPDFPQPPASCDPAAVLQAPELVSK